MGARLDGLVDVHDVADGAHDDLRVAARAVHRGSHLGHDLARVVAGVADPAVEEADVASPCIEGHHRLVERHAARGVDRDVHLGQAGDQAQLVPADRHLDGEALVVAEVRHELLRLADHLVGVHGEHLDGQRQGRTELGDEVDDVPDDLPVVPLLLLGEDRRVGGDPGSEPAAERRLNLRQVSRIDKQLHVRTSDRVADAETIAHRLPAVQVLC